MGDRIGSNPPPLRAHLLGEVRLAVGDRVIPEQAWPRRTARTLLLLLLVTPGYRLPRDRVLDLLWPDAAPEVATRGLYQALHALRRVLEPGLRAGRASAYVEAARDAVSLRRDVDIWVDSTSFDAAMARADAAPSSERAAHLRDALSLYGGDLLTDEPYADWPAMARERMRQSWRRAVLTLAEHDLASGDARLTVTALERALATDPTDEVVLQALMRAFVAMGRREEAMRRYEAGVAALRDELGVEPSEETENLAAELRAAPAPSRPRSIAPPRLDALPAPPNPLIGRAPELEALQDLLLDPGVRLVTIVGTGGMGKTRLAIEVARQVAADFTAGVCFVPLGSLQDAGLLMATVARVLGIEEAPGRPIVDTLAGALHERELLLVLDNVEQLLSAAVDVAALLAGCPDLTILATSREPLEVRAEHVFDLPALSTPTSTGDGGLTAEAAMRYEAVALFVQRARAVRHDWRLSDADASTVATLCVRLDGLPLAIELAAVQARLLTPSALLAGLSDRFALLSAGFRDMPPRQRTMRDAIAWSHDLLTGDEQILFRRLAIFTGGCAFDAARAVAGDGLVGARQGASGDTAVSIADLLAALVAQRLLRQEETDARSRYEMLETIRDYGRERLATSGEEETLRQTHAAFFLDLVERAESELTGPEQAAWLDRLDADHDNLRAALAGTLQRGDRATMLRLAAPLWRFWLMRGYLNEGREWLGRSLETEAGVPARLRLAALLAAASLADHQNDSDAARDQYEQALTIATQLGDRGALASALGGLGRVAQVVGAYEQATGYLEQALPIQFELADRWNSTSTLNDLGAVAYFTGDYDRATERWTECLSLLKEIGDVRAKGRILGNLGALALQRGDLTGARELHEESLALHRGLGDPIGLASALCNLGGTLYTIGDLDGGVAMLEEALRLHRELGDDRNIAITLVNLAEVQRGRDATAMGVVLLQEAIELFHGGADRFGMAGALEALAGAISTLGSPEQAVRLFSAAASLRESIGGQRESAGQADYDRDLTAARVALGQEVFAAAWAEGAALTVDEAVAEALSLDS